MIFGEWMIWIQIYIYISISLSIYIIICHATHYLRKERWVCHLGVRAQSSPRQVASTGLQVPHCQCCTSSSARLLKGLCTVSFPPFLLFCERHREQEKLATWNSWKGFIGKKKKISSEFVVSSLNNNNMSDNMLNIFSNKSSVFSWGKKPFISTSWND